MKKFTDDYFKKRYQILADRLVNKEGFIDEMAYDPDFAIEFLAEKLSQKKGHLWSCYRKYYSV